VLAWLAYPANTLLALNRLGRGNAALFLVLSFGAIGRGLSLSTHLVFALTAALWYNGVNDLFDLEVDRVAYAGASQRKVLLNGAMTALALRAWLVSLALLSLVLFVVELGLRLEAIALFCAGILSGVVYNASSKHLARPSIVKSILLDAIVGGPFYFFYASLAWAQEPGPDRVVLIATLGSLLVLGLYGNFIFMAKDLSTDSMQTLPKMLGSSVRDDGTVRHSVAGIAYLSAWCAVACALFGWAGINGYWFGFAFAARSVVATVQVASGKVRERGHKKIFIELSNWVLVFLLSLYFPRLGLADMTELVLLGGAIILANVAYFHDQARPRPLMLRLGKARAA
jgi:hypothetical protein